MQTSALMTRPVAVQSRIVRPSTITSLRAPAAPVAARRSFVVRAEVIYGFIPSSCSHPTRFSLFTIYVTTCRHRSLILSQLPLLTFASLAGPRRQGKGRIQGCQERRQGRCRLSKGGCQGRQGRRQGWRKGRVSSPCTLLAAS